MPEYLSPGVYVEEVERGPRPVEGVGTSTAGFLGETERGPTAPQLVTSLADFRRTFGGFASGSYLPYAVDGFFRNGGSRCYVGRVTAEDDVAGVTMADAGGDEVVRLAAVGPGSWGRNVAVAVEDTALGDDRLFRLRVATWRGIEPGGRSYDEALEELGDPTQEEVYEDLSPEASSSNYYEKRLAGVSTLVEVPPDWDASGRPENGTYWLGGENADPGGNDGEGGNGNGNGDGNGNDDGDPSTIPEDDELEGMSYRDLQTLAEPFDVDRSQSKEELVEALGAIRDEPEARPDGGAVTASLSDFSGATTPGARTGLAAFEEIDEIAIVCVPDEVRVPDLTEAIENHCANMGDRFAVLQAPRNAGDIADLRPPVDSTYAAFYYPWIEVNDPETNVRRLVPPGGHVAGIYARSDTERGVHKAPANEVVRGALAPQLALTTGEQDVLNPRGVNCIRSFRGRGIRVWGARTTSSDPLWRYVNVRRLFLYLEESIDEATQWVVFEPNDEGLWARVRQTVRNFLTTEWRNGALAGTTPEAAFYVKCDRTTMTQDDIDNGRLIVEVGVAPVKPAEFVVFRITQWTGGADET